MKTLHLPGTNSRALPANQPFQVAIQIQNDEARPLWLRALLLRYPDPSGPAQWDDCRVTADIDATTDLPLIMAPGLEFCAMGNRRQSAYVQRLSFYPMLLPEGANITLRVQTLSHAIPAGALHCVAVLETERDATAAKFGTMYLGGYNLQDLTTAQSDASAAFLIKNEPQKDMFPSEFWLRYSGDLEAAEVRARIPASEKPEFMRFPLQFCAVGNRRDSLYYQRLPLRGVRWPKGKSMEIGVGNLPSDIAKQRLHAAVRCDYAV